MVHARPPSSVPPGAPADARTCGLASPRAEPVLPPRAPDEDVDRFEDRHYLEDRPPHHG